MSEKAAMKRILVQLDADAQPSVFDRVVAVDAGAEHIFAYGGVTADQVTGLVHGAIFTRGPKDLHNTAVFIGGNDVGVGEELLELVTKSFFGPMRVSVMLDANGANTTAAAAVIAAGKHLDLSNITATVLGGTGPVGQRASLLLASEGATVRLCSRSKQRAEKVAKRTNEQVDGNRISGVEVSDDQSLQDSLQGAQLVIAAGAAGVELLPASIRKEAADLKVAIDLNAVPPLGIEGVDFADKAKLLDGMTVYGAIGVGGLKMKIHRAAIGALFESNDKVFDAEAIYALGKAL